MEGWTDAETWESGPKDIVCDAPPIADECELNDERSRMDSLWGTGEPDAPATSKAAAVQTKADILTVSIIKTDGL